MGYQEGRENFPWVQKPAENFYYGFSIAKVIPSAVAQSVK